MFQVAISSRSIEMPTGEGEPRQACPEPSRGGTTVVIRPVRSTVAADPADGPLVRPPDRRSTGSQPGASRPSDPGLRLALEPDARAGRLVPVGDVAAPLPDLAVLGRPRRLRPCRPGLGPRRAALPGRPSGQLPGDDLLVLRPRQDARLGSPPDVLRLRCRAPAGLPGAPGRLEPEVLRRGLARPGRLARVPGLLPEPRLQPHRPARLASPGPGDHGPPDRASLARPVRAGGLGASWRRWPSRSARRSSCSCRPCSWRPRRASLGRPSARTVGPSVEA